MNFNIFHKYLYNPDELDSNSREKEDCMKKVKNLPRKEKSSYNSGKIWDQMEMPLA
jgi:hypothetical protein